MKYEIPKKDCKDCIRGASMNTSSLNATFIPVCVPNVFCVLLDQSKIRHVNGRKLLGHWRDDFEWNFIFAVCEDLDLERS